LINALPALRRNPHCREIVGSRSRPDPDFPEIDLVKTISVCLPKASSSLMTLSTAAILLLHPRMTQINHVNEQISFAHFLQRGFEDSIKVCGRLRKNPRIGKQNALFIGSVKLRVVGSRVRRFIDREDAARSSSSTA